MLISFAYQTISRRLHVANTFAANICRTLSAQTEAISKTHNTSFPVLKVDIDCSDSSYHDAAAKGMKSIQQLDKIMAVLANGGKYCKLNDLTLAG